MRYVATVTAVDGRFIAQCTQVDVAGEGTTEAAAVESLRRELELYLRESSAVAPPSDTAFEPVEVIVA